MDEKAAAQSPGLVRTKYIYLAAAVAFLTLAGYFIVPGHVYLYSDTQIYVPELEKHWDPGLFSGDILVQHSQFRFTIYHEVAWLLRRVTGLGYFPVLAAQQLLFRAAAVLGILLIANAFQLSLRTALLAAAACSLGSLHTAAGVLVLEYEPVPRGFAVPLLLLAVGLIAHRRRLGGNLSASLAFLYHPPATVPFWAVYSSLAVFRMATGRIRHHLAAFWPLLAACMILVVLSRLQPGGAAVLPVFKTIEPEMEQLQRMALPWNWVSMWGGYWYRHYVMLWVICLVAFLRVRKYADEDLKSLLFGLPLFGLISIPLSYLLLEKLKWAFMTQIQLGRAVMFLTAFAGILPAVAGLKAVARRSYAESMLWFCIVFSLPGQLGVSHFFSGLADPLIRQRILVVAALAALYVAAAWAQIAVARWRTPALVAALVVPFVLIAYVAKVPRYAQPGGPELEELARWAGAATSKDAVFLFPDAGRELYPGVFRAKALRAVFVDWKSGAYVNFSRPFAYEWLRRWRQTMARGFDPSAAGSYAALGIDYVVLRLPHSLPGREPVFRNRTFVAYQMWP